MKRSTLSLLLGAALLAPVVMLVPAAPALAATTQGAPSQLVLDNSTRVLRTLEARRAEFAADRNALDKFISGEFNKMFDRDYAARLVLGRHARGADPADIKLFADALADSLTSRYGASLVSFDSGLKVKVNSETSLRGGAIVKVSSEFIRKNGNTVPVDYLMHKDGGKWKVFDVMVEGVSFVQTFRGQFDQPLSRKGIAAVAADLRDGKMSADAGR
ncbi:MAG TPA: ABC transporter substrate-binding protein [Xanthomonadaceae bacterium]|nr:ABC transporter substrate-binding protein [Xanthomonadaceae bacterium]